MGRHEPMRYSVSVTTTQTPIQTFSHTEHTDVCMSDWAENANGSMKHGMNAETVQMNHRSHMWDAWEAAGRDSKAPRPAHWPTTDHEWCGYMRGLDVQYGSHKTDPNHHDNACPIHAKAKVHPNLDDRNRARLDKLAAL